MGRCPAYLIAILSYLKGVFGDSFHIEHINKLQQKNPCKKKYKKNMRMGKLMEPVFGLTLNGLVLLFLNYSKITEKINEQI